MPRDFGSRAHSCSMDRAPPVSFNVSPVPSGQFIEMKDVTPPEE
jgi:hypothetical protein